MAIALLLVGAGGHARACMDVIELDGRYSIQGLVGLPEEVGTAILGVPVLGTDQDLPALARKFGAALVTVGQVKSPDMRMRLFTQLQALDYDLPSIVSPRAHVSRHATVGAGTIVMHGAVVNAAATVGRNCIINTQSLVEHDAQVGDHCHVATSAIINSGVRVGEGSFVGSGSTVRQMIRIGQRCVVGMGQRVVKDCPDGAWLPARKDMP
ncbi:acetyltransferase [Denitratisoma sp. agr-D3]